jgi:FlaG/FlaF family flagellin (archaellin)
VSPAPNAAAASDERALAPLAGVLLLATVVVLGGVVAATLVGVGATDLRAAPTVGATCSADAATGTLSVTHRAGDALDPATLRIRVRVDGDPLAHQPPVPFFASEGFASGPTGPFNRGWTGQWSPGTTASLRLAGTNSALPVGATVRVRLWADGHPVVDCSTTA